MQIRCWTCKVLIMWIFFFRKKVLYLRFEISQILTYESNYIFFFFNVNLALRIDSITIDCFWWEGTYFYT